MKGQRLELESESMMQGYMYAAGEYTVKEGAVMQNN